MRLKILKITIGCENLLVTTMCDSTNEEVCIRALNAALATGIKKICG